MENFDLDINNNDVRTEVGVPAKIIRMKINSDFEGEETISETSDEEVEKSKVDKKPKEKAWYEKLSDITKTFKGLTTYGANKQGYNITEEGLDPKGTRVKILGLDPFVFVAVSLTLVIASSIAIVVISKKQAKL